MRDPALKWLDNVYITHAVQCQRVIAFLASEHDPKECTGIRKWTSYKSSSWSVIFSNAWHEKYIVAAEENWYFSVEYRLFLKMEPKSLVDYMSTDSTAFECRDINDLVIPVNQKV